MQVIQVVLIAAKVMLSLGILFYASWSDYKTREVSNRVWAYYAPLALVLSLLELVFYNSVNLPYFGLSFGVTALFAILLFYSGGFGGADSKALMCIALALPFAPTALFTPIITGAISPLSQFLFPLTIFSNAVLFAAASGIYMILRNIIWHKKTGNKMFEGTLSKESWGKKILVLITGYKFQVSKLKEKWHIYPMEDIEQAQDGTSLNRKLMVIPKDEGRDNILNRLSDAVETGKIGPYVWATPGLPMLIFVTLGLIVALVFGDVVWVLVRSVLG
jgi:preflagellin peptidase FlaK